MANGSAAHTVNAAARADHLPQWLVRRMQVMAVAVAAARLVDADVARALGVRGSRGERSTAVSEVAESNLVTKGRVVSTS